MKQNQLTILAALVFLHHCWAKGITINDKNVENLKVSFFTCYTLFAGDDRHYIFRLNRSGRGGVLDKHCWNPQKEYDNLGWKSSETKTRKSRHWNVKVRRNNAIPIAPMTPTTTSFLTTQYFRVGISIGFFTNTQNWQYWYQRLSETENSSNKMLPPVRIESRTHDFKSDTLLSEPTRYLLVSQKGECQTWNQRSQMQSSLEVIFCCSNFYFLIVKRLMPILSISSSPWKLRVRFIQHEVRNKHNCVLMNGYNLMLRWQLCLDKLTIC